MRKVAIVGAMMLVAAVGLAQPPPSPAATGTVRGTVTSTFRGPLGFASLVVAGTRLGARADSMGRFELRLVPVGPHRILVQALGYRRLDTLVTVAAGENPPLDVDLVDRVAPPPCQPCFWVDPFQSTHDPNGGGIGPEYDGAFWQAHFGGPSGELMISSEVDPCELRIQYAFPAAVERASLTVVDWAGRVVRRFAADPSAGHHHEVWDGKDTAGRFTGYGWYRVRVEMPRDTLALDCLRVRQLPLH